MAVKSISEIKATLRSNISIYAVRRTSANSTIVKKRLNTKLSIWRRRLKRFSQWEDKLKDIDDLIKEFIGASSKGTVFAQNKEKILAKHIMCRYALDRGISGKFVREFIGCKGQWTVGKIRMRFIRRCQADKQLKSIWNNFLTFAKENKND